MDFLPRPQGCPSVYGEIQCLATAPFDGGEFETFPSRNQWGHSRTAAVWSRLFKQPPAEFLAFLQTWLYFGTLELIFNRRISLQELTQKSATSEKLVLNTSPLKEWLSGVSPIETDASERLHRVVYANQIHSGFYSKKIIVTDPEFKLSLEEYILHGCFHDPRDPLIVASIGILLDVGREYLAQSFPFRDVHEQIYGNMAGMIGVGINVPSWTNPFSSRLREHGWCPSEIRMMERKLNTSGLYYMSHIPRPHPSRRHQMVRFHVDGSDLETAATDELCSETRCRFLQINPSTYHTKHRRDCQQSKCRNMGVNLEQVLEILQTGSIPLISPISGDDDSDNLTVISSNPDFKKPYFAISHVWSDGLGNLQRSALPRCQLLHLSKLVRKLAWEYFESELPIYFWIDTIGCPPDDIGHKEAQNLAISLMPQTYENATAVLVLDSWLQETKVAHLPHHEILMRIITCNWNSRLWTLQEAALARDLFFQFADMVYNVNRGVASLGDNEDPLLASTLRVLIEERMYEIQAVSQKKWNQKSKLIALAGALSNRSTSVLSDEAICLATLLKFSSSDFNFIIRTPPSDRMRVFWCLFDHIPGRFLDDDFSRLQVAGYHWAPRTFLADGKNRRQVIAPTADLVDILPSRTAAGLVFECSGVLIHAGEEPIGGDFYFLDENNRKYSIHCRIEDARHVIKKSAASYYATVDLTDSNIDEIDLQECDLGEIYHINLFKSYGTPQLAIIFLHKDTTSSIRVPVVLAGLQRSHRGVNYCRLICSGTCTPVDGPEFGKLEEVNPPLPVSIHAGKARFIGGDCVLNSYGILSFVRGIWSAPKQQWCLD